MSRIFKTIDLIAGARPNFMKIAPIIDALRNAEEGGGTLRFRLIHTGQHYDRNMSGSFFEQLGIPEPDVNFGVGGGTQAEQTAGIMKGYESLLAESRSDLCLVVGDVTSTMACTITAKKMGLPVAHVEAGIRSGDMSMPEEVNRIVTDSLSDYFFTTSETANANLRQAGVSDKRIFFVGNTMIDTLLKHQNSFVKPRFWESLGLNQGSKKRFLVLTLHRPANVDDGEALGETLEAIAEHADNVPIIFPVHPRTRSVLNNAKINFPNLHCVDPLTYLEFNYLVSQAFGVITDSGGITEEATVMGIPCLTLRDNTERPETVTLGTNVLVGTDPKKIPPVLGQLMNGKWKVGQVPPLWDGKTGARIIVALEKVLATKSSC